MPSSVPVRPTNTPTQQRGEQTRVIQTFQERSEQGGPVRGLSGSGLCGRVLGDYPLQLQVVGVQLQPQLQGAQLQGLHEQVPH